MKRNEAFTLVELLVVIAIIAILAGIILPNVPRYIAKARMVRAYGEVKNIDLALTKMLTDANRQDFRSGFFDAYPSETFGTAVDTYQNVFYILLRKGKAAEADPKWPGGVVINTDVKRKLGSQYMDLAADPWGQLYYFYPGPWRDPNDEFGGRVPFRIYFPDLSVPGGPVTDADSVTGVVDPDDPDGEPFDVGYPAARDLTVYVWSSGMNLLVNQVGYPNYDGDPAEVGLDFIGGGDDINNWDNDQSWQGFYN